MLKHFNSDPDDIERLESSYNAIKQTEFLSIVTGENETKNIFRKTANALSIPGNADFSFLNLFKISLPTSHFYIAQCLLDFGYPVSGRNMQSSSHKYHFQLIGIGNLTTNLGNTFLRPETKMDKIVGRFFDHDIDFSGYDVFNDKFYLVSNNKEQVHKTFDKAFIHAISKYKNLYLTITGTEMYIWFDRELNDQQSVIVEDIFSHCSFLSL